MKLLGLSLAFSDFRFDRSMAFTLILAVAAVLTPLMILLGLKTGIIESARQQLLSDPRNLEVVIYQNTDLSQQWFDDMAQSSDVRFIIPRTRTINATLTLVNENRNTLQNIELLPTQTGDPLFSTEITIPQDSSEIVISQSVATALNVKSGDSLQGLINRRWNDQNQHVLVPLKIIGVLPETAMGREAVFVTLDFLLASEDYRDGYQVLLFGVEEGEPPRQQGRQVYANARLYATDLDAVLSLAEQLRSKGLEVRTRATEIETIRRMDQLLSFVFSVIAVIASLGGAIALGANIWSNVDRKRKDLALLRLMGLSSGQLLMIPVWYALAVASGAFALAFAAYQLAATLFNQQLQASLPEQSYACVLHPEDGLLMLAATLLTALLIAIIAGLRARRIDPAECLREIN